MQDDAAGGGWSVPGSLVEQPQADAPAGGPLPPLPTPGSGWTGSGPGPGGPPPPNFGAAGPFANGRVGDVDAPAAAPVPKLALKPMTVADVLDGAFAIIKARPARIFAITALVVIPLQLFVAWWSRNNFDQSFFDAFDSDDPAVYSETAGTDIDYGYMIRAVAVTLLPTLGWTLVAAAIAHMVAAWTAGRDVAGGQLLGVIGRRIVPLLVAWTCIHAVEGASIMVCNLGFPFVMALFVVTGPVIGAEGLGPFAAMRRATNLCGRRYWATLGVGLLIGLVYILLNTALGGALQLAAVFAGFEVGWILLAVGTIVGSVVTTPFVAAAVVLLYLDLRVRTEGLDIELAAIDLAHDAA